MGETDMVELGDYFEDRGDGKPVFQVTVPQGLKTGDVLFGGFGHKSDIRIRGNSLPVICVFRIVLPSIAGLRDMKSTYVKGS